ncbi:MAG: hypothetical protein A2Z94_06410 [Gallionellales bacterium GWA2_55_18]|nr:MAG: hypothetical protein A2Z94_06410 [Gallionellales bacterium GWA2_55_18]
MITSWAETQIEREIIAKLEQLSNGENDYWSFRKSAQRHGVHGLIRYPAMMIPTMQAKLLEITRGKRTDALRVLDPFMGAGTMLTEAMEQGMNFSGFDINPLAILACKVKAGPYSLTDIAEQTKYLLERIHADSRRYYEVHFAGQSKWFTKGASISLSRIRRAIQEIDDVWLRRFYWLSMAELIRQCSNSRTSTYKLHIKLEGKIFTSMASVLELFTKILNSNVERVKAQYRIFQKSDLLEANGSYRGHVELKFQDVTKINHGDIDARFDLLFTSPPYGDNLTTIPYGQFSFLALNWIPIEDIDTNIPLDINKNTHSIDSASMGGSLRDSPQKAGALFSRSRTFKRFFCELENGNPSATKRLSSFCFDLHKSIESLSRLMAPQGHMVWTLGNRSIGGKRVPLDEIVSEFLDSYNVRRVAKFNRPIPCKRTPIRNNQSDTMQNEVVIIARA